MNHAITMKYLPILFVLTCSLYACQNKLSKTAPPIPTVEAGVSETLAQYRKQAISNINYKMHLDIPEGKSAAIAASSTISFDLQNNAAPLQLDFKEQKESLKNILVNGKKVPVMHEKEHILLNKEWLSPGRNTVEIEFTAGNLSLNRNEDYLYTLLVPDRSRTVFPVFDQPDLKATFQLSLTVPSHWHAVANGPLMDTLVTGNRKTFRFATSDLVSTYLFAFVAGEFDLVQQQVNGSPMSFYHRETDSTKIKMSLGPIFQIHEDALNFMKEYTAIPYPYQKLDIIAIPDFQYNGMEHTGAIDYKASSLFLDSAATQKQKINRSNLIAHEVAHMWFGNLVTMRWFNDVWMKEVFANFMADKITQIALADNNFDLKFLTDHFPAAYEVDRTTGANPIRQPLNNLQDAGTLYGSIIYHKAPIVMRQLERLMGPEAFREGLREYLKQYANSNASWPDLIAILDKNTPIDLQRWNNVWVNDAGRPIHSYQLKTDGNAISQLLITQAGEDGSHRFWPQKFEIALVYPDRVEELTVTMDQAQISLTAAAGKPVPSYIIFNSSGQGYGLFPVDAPMLPNLHKIKDPVTRASAYINLYENMLNGGTISPEAMLTFVRKSLTQEKEELNVKLLTDQLSHLFWQYTLPDNRKALAVALEKELWSTMQQHQATNIKKILLQAYQDVALSEQALQRLYGIWLTEQAPSGIKLSEDDYTALALTLALKEYKPSKTLLEQQLSRIKNPDRKKRLQFMMPALSEVVSERDTFFASLKSRQNREKEAWVAAALGYLHHPLRADSSIRYLRESLDLLQEIQLTGDIFFPYNWLRATLGNYQQKEAAQIVRNFLKAHPDFNPRLKAKLLQTADGIFRAEKLLHTNNQPASGK